MCGIIKLFAKEVALNTEFGASFSLYSKLQSAKLEDIFGLNKYSIPETGLNANDLF